MFDTVLRMAVAGSPGSDRRWRSLPISLALHGVVLGTVALLSARTLSDSPEPDAPIVFLQGNAPPLPIVDSFSALERPQRDDAVIPATLVQPQEAADETEARSASTDTVPEESGDPSGQSPAGDPSGRTNGSFPGLPGSVGREGPRAGDSERPFFPGGDVAEPRLLHRVEPAYSETQRKLRLEGVVVLQAIISGVGAVEEVRVVKSVHPLLDAEAVRAVSLWRYRPATLNGRPVPRLPDGHGRIQASVTDGKPGPLRRETAGRRHRISDLI